MRQLFLLSLLLLALPRIASAQTYTIAALGDFYPSAINNLGQVIGGSTFWDKGKFTSLRMLAVAINNRGQIVGFVETGLSSHNFSQAGSEVHAFLWQNGNRQELKPPKKYALFFPSGINDQGQIVGACNAVPLLWENGRVTYLQSPYRRGVAAAQSIDDQGQIAGTSDIDSNNGHALLWQNGRLIDLGSFPNGYACEAIATNNAMQIIGNAILPKYKLRHACLWQKRNWRDLGALPGDKQSRAGAINAAGQIVGWSYLRQTAYGRSSRAFLWRSGKMLDLTALLPPYSGWALEFASGINDRGQIVGTGAFKGKRCGFILTPKS